MNFFHRSGIEVTALVGNPPVASVISKSTGGRMEFLTWGAAPQGVVVGVSACHSMSESESVSVVDP